jgi:ubiquitin carboxyl-terminal hydrolase 7
MAVKINMLPCTALSDPLQVSKALGVPVECQRYWSWVRRPNGSVRVARVLTAEEEGAQIMDLREHRDQVRCSEG